MKSILIVDDESKIRGIYHDLFSGGGHRILETSSASGAYDMLVREKIDLVLLDINMPEIDGDIVHELIETFHLYAKVIVCSVRPVVEQRQIVRGAAGYYDKSEGFEALRVKVEKYFSEERGREEKNKEGGDRL